MKKLNKGFTIIELLVVIAIIGILAGTVIPKLIKEIRKATVAKVQHNLGVIRSRLSLDETFLEEFPDLAGEDNSDLLELYRIEATPGFTDAKGNHEESSQVFPSRNDEGGWYYIRETGEIYANLPNGAYTKDEEYEIWNDDKNGSESVSYDFTDIDIFSPSEAANIDGWSKIDYATAVTSNPYNEYNIEVTATFSENEDKNTGYGIYIQAEKNENGKIDGYILQYDRAYGQLVIKEVVDSMPQDKDENGNESRIFLDTSDINMSGDWWTTEHTIQIDVTDSTTDSPKQNVKISIDNDVISDSYRNSYSGVFDQTSLTIDNSDANNYTGIRAWGDGDTDIDSVSITEL